MTALALSVACTVLAGMLFLGGATVAAMAALAVSFAFDALFVLALRAEKKDHP
jgi:uncharacterized protein YabE (DUF348 family)